MAETTPKNEFKYFITPTYYLDYDSTKKWWKMEVQLPGVTRDQVKLKILPTGFFLRATRDQALYEIADNTPFDIDPESVTAKYENGLLQIEGKIKDPLANAFEIKLT